MIVRTGEFAREKNPLIGTNVTNTGKGDSVIAVSPAVARDRIRAGMRQALEGDLSAHPLPSAAEYELRLRFEHHGDAYKCVAGATVPRIAVSALSCSFLPCRCQFYPRARLEGSQTVVVESDSFTDIASVFQFF